MPSRRPRDRTRSTRKRFVRLFKDSLPVRERYNACYSRRKIGWPLIQAMVSNGYVEEAVQDDRAERLRVPDGDTVFYRLGQASVSEIRDYFHGANDALLAVAERMGLMDEPMDFGADFHDLAWFGGEEVHLVGTNMAGTCWAHRIGTIESVVHGRRLCFQAVPVVQTTSKADVIDALVAGARRWCPIRRLFIDRAAFTVACLRKLDELKVPYVIPAQRNARVKRAIKEGRPFSKHAGKGVYVRISQFTLGGKNTVTTTLVVLYRPPKEEGGEEDVFAYVTNIPVTTENAVELGEEYRKRWGVETGFRMKKKLRGKTNSPRYSVRLLFLLLSVLLYNLFILLNAILGFGEDGKRYRMTLHMFRTAVEREAKG